MVVVSLVIFVPKVTRAHAIEKPWLSRSVLFLPSVVLHTASKKQWVQIDDGNSPQCLNPLSYVAR